MNAIKLLWLTPLWVGCVTEKNFGSKYAKTSCEKYEECFPDEFANWYGDMDQCRETGEDAWEQTKGLLSLFCDLDYDYAKDCLNDMEDASCDAMLTGVESSACDSFFN